MSKLQLTDTILDIMVKMSEGNIGALTCLMEMERKQDWYANVDSIIMILQLDTLELYGSNLYMLWDNCCDRDLNKMELVLRNWQMGHLTKEEIHKNLNSGRGIPFTNLKSLKELFEG
jgi:hypothetical protein